MFFVVFPRCVVRVGFLINAFVHVYLYCNALELICSVLEFLLFFVELQFIIFGSFHLSRVFVSILIQFLLVLCIVQSIGVVC